MIIDFFFQGSVKCLFCLYFSRWNMCSHARGSRRCSTGPYQGQVNQWFFIIMINNYHNWLFIYLTNECNMHFALTYVQELEFLMWQIYIVCKMWQTFSFVIHVCMAVGLRLVLCWQWCVGGVDGEVSLHLPVPPPRPVDQDLRGGQAQWLPPVAGTSFTSTSIKMYM